MMRMVSLRNLTQFLLLFTTSLLYHHGCSHATNQDSKYITPNPNTPCPEEPCLTLDQFAQEVQHDLTSNTTLIFLPGDHNLTRDIKITNIGHFAMLGDTTTQSPPGSRIVCTSPASITIESIFNLEISFMAVFSCGSGSSSGAIHVQLVEDFQLSNVTFQNSMDVSLKVCGSNGVLRGTQFIDNMGVGVNITRSTVRFKGGNCFLRGHGGGVVSYGSTLIFSDFLMFASNIAENGGGILAERSIIYCNGRLSFMINSVFQYGGGMYAYNSTLNCEGQISFMHNTALGGGGGFAWESSTVNINGDSSFPIIQQNMVVEFLHWKVAL